jgi:hypothetical protein
MAGALILTDTILGTAGKHALGPASVVNSNSPPAYGHVMIYERDNPSKIAYAWLGETPPTPTLTGGGQDWQEIAMPFRRSILVWRGASLLTLVLPIVMEGPSGNDEDGAFLVTQWITALAEMWRSPGDGSTRPPVVRITSGSHAIPYFDLDYVVQDPGWGDAIATGNTLTRYQQKFNLTLTEYREDTRLQAYSIAGVKKGAVVHARTYVVKHGDTLSSIAKKLKVSGGWQALARNQKPPISDPRRIKVGQRLSLSGLKFT